MHKHYVLYDSLDHFWHITPPSNFRPRPDTGLPGLCCVLETLSFGCLYICDFDYRQWRVIRSLMDTCAMIYVSVINRLAALASSLRRKLGLAHRARLGWSAASDVKRTFRLYWHFIFGWIVAFCVGNLSPLTKICFYFISH